MTQGIVLFTTHKNSHFPRNPVLEHRIFANLSDVLPSPHVSRAAQWWARRRLSRSCVPRRGGAVLVPAGAQVFQGLQSQPERRAEQYVPPMHAVRSPLCIVLCTFHSARLVCIARGMSKRPGAAARRVCGAALPAHAAPYDPDQSRGVYT